MDVVFVIPGELPGPSGGTHYNEAVITALRRLGHHVVVCSIPGAWPRPGTADRMALRDAMRGSGAILVDGIMALAAPEAVHGAVAGGASVHVMVHSLLTADPTLGRAEQVVFEVSQRSALLAASSVSCVSLWSAQDVRERYPDVTVGVAEPGCEVAGRAKGSTPPQLLVLAALSRLKNQASVLRVLRDLSDVPWSLQLAGSDSVDPIYCSELRRLTKDLPPGRVTFRGALTGPALDTLWNATDLLLLTSTSETYGMVVTEALARGIPAVVPAGTGAVEALLGASEAATGQLAGAVVDARDEAELRRVLRAWLTSAHVRHAWSAAAARRRTTLKPWTWTAQRLLEIVQR